MESKRQEPTMSSIVLARVDGLLRWGTILSIACLMAIGSAIAMVPKIAARQGSGQATQERDLVNRVTQLEVLCGANKLQGDRDQKSSQFLAQFYTAEYSAIMAR